MQYYWFRSSRLKLRFFRLHWRRMESVAISFLHDGSYRCGLLIVWLVENLDFSFARRIDTYIARNFLLLSSCCSTQLKDIVHKAMVLLDIHFVLWRWLSLRSAFRRSVCEIDTVGVERGKGSVEICLLGVPSTTQCNKWISGNYGIADRYCPLDTYSPWVSRWEWPRHCPCIIWCGHHRSWWPGTFLGMWCYIGKHCFSFSSAWGVWPLLPLYNMVSIFIYWSWICTLQHDWDLWPLVSIVYLEYLVILHRMAIWCFQRNSCFTRDYLM